MPYIKALHCLQADTKTKFIYENYYSKDAKGFLEILELIYEKGVDPVTEAIEKLIAISPLDLSASKVKLLCEKLDELKADRNTIGSDYLSIKTKNTLSQYDALREVQKERAAV